MQEEDKVSNGRPHAYADLFVDLNTKTFNLTVIEREGEKKKEEKNCGEENKNGEENELKKRTITIDLKTNGISIESIPEPVVAANSLEKKSREDAQTKFDKYTSTILEKEESRKKLEPTNKVGKENYNKQIAKLIRDKIKVRDQMLGRPPRQGWLRMKFTTKDSASEEICELVFSPIETKSSFLVSENEFERGKKENYQNNFEKCRQVVIDSVSDTKEMRAMIQKDLTHVMSKLSSMKQFTTTNAADDLFQQFNKETRGMADIDQRIQEYQQKQQASLLRIKRRVQHVEDGNLVRDNTVLFVLVVGCWLLVACCLLAFARSDVGSCS